MCGNKHLTTLVLILIFFAPFLHAEDNYWDEYKFDAKGHFELVSVTNNDSPSNTQYCQLSSSPGSVSGTCTYPSEDGESGSSTGSATWDAPPQTAKENQPLLLTAQLSKTEEGRYIGYYDIRIFIDSNAGLCSTFQDIGTDFSIPYARAEQTQSGSATKTLNYRFPSFYKPWICNQQTLAENNQGQGSDTMRAEALRKDTYFFNLTVIAEVPGGKSTYIYLYKWVPGASAGADLSGKITDGHNDPMPYMNLTLDYLGKSYLTNTDETGNYVFKDVVGLQSDTTNPPSGVLTAYASYWRDGKNYFALYDKLNADRMLVLQKKFLLKTDSDMTQDLDFSIPAPAGKYRLKSGEAGSDKVPWLKDGEEVASASSLMNLQHFAPVYYYTANALDFDLTIINANIDYKLPVDIYLAGSAGTFYSRPDSSIQIDKSDVTYGSSNRPRNREYHEFSHHLLFSQWNGEGLRSGTDVNHNGFMNSNTADSYTEGFAEFMSLVIADYTNNPNDPAPSDIYAGFGSLENNYKPWEARGSDEELAVAGVLWDIYDKNNDDGDTVSIPIQKLWTVLSVKRANFYEYTKALKAAFPDQSAGIDKILLAHGFYPDIYVGNKVRDVFEPYIDSNGDKNYTLGEPFVDYGIDAKRAQITYDGKGEVGRATNYERPTRGKAVEIPNAFIKVNDQSVGFYLVSVHFNNPAQGKDYSYSTDMREGKIYLQPLPEGTDAKITIKPISNAFVASSEYETTASDYLSKYYAAPDSDGFADTHDFKLQSTGKAEDPSLQFFNSKWGTDKGTDEVNTAVGVIPRDLPLAAGSAPASSKLPCMPGFALLSVILAVAFIGYRKH